MVVLGSLSISLVNGVGEEVLWRGMYLRASTRHRWLAYPVGFAPWHYGPLSVQPNRRPGGNNSFVAVCLALGLLWGNVANRNHSIRWTAATYLLFDLAGLGALVFVPTHPLPPATVSATFADHPC
jgi:membrane protease YdiL (CAAX protease family)